MTTTDFDVVRGIKPVPYHIYLMPPHKRGMAYWSSICEAQLFDTPQEAETEIARSLRGLYPHQPNTTAQVVPVDDSKMPAYWELRQEQGASIMKRTTEVYSIFGQIDAVVAAAMASEGKVRRIEADMIPPTALFDDQGRKAVFAIVMPNEYAAEYMDRVAALRA